MTKRLALTGILLFATIAIATTSNYPSLDLEKGSLEWRLFELKNKLLYRAIRSVESTDGRDTVNEREQAYGDVQIRQVAIDQLNQCYNTKTFTLAKAFSDEWSYLYFTLTMAAYNPEMNFEKGARIWNGGVFGHLQSCTIPYWRKVSARLEKLRYAK